MMLTNESLASNTQKQSLQALQDMEDNCPEVIELARPATLPQLIKLEHIQLQSNNRHNSISLYGDGSFALRIKTHSKRTYLWDFLGSHDGATAWLRTAAAVRCGTASSACPAGLSNPVCVLISTFVPFPVTLDFQECQARGQNWDFVLDLAQSVSLVEEYSGCSLTMPAWNHNPNDKSDFDYENGSFRMYGYVPRSSRHSTRQGSSGSKKKNIPLGRRRSALPCPGGGPNGRSPGAKSEGPRSPSPPPSPDAACSAASVSCLSTLT